MSMHPEKYCLVLLMGSRNHRFKDEAYRNVTVNAARYQFINPKVLLPKMQEMGLIGMWFKQGKATWHTAGPNEEGVR